MAKCGFFATNSGVLCVANLQQIHIHMNFDPYTGQPIHRNGIWNSGCLSKETAIQNTIYQYLEQNGWQQDNTILRKWQRQNRKIVVCLVDDIRSCSDNYHVDLPYLFDKNTHIITDGYIGCPTQYRIWNLPPSFFHIYSHCEPMQAWQPERLFAFSVNRIDQRRLKLMLELGKKIYVDKGFVNFNCQKDFDGNEFGGRERLAGNFEYFYQQLSNDDQNLWRDSFATLISRMPLKNYDHDHADIWVRSWLNIECETYSSDTSAAFSEKIFRLLTTPAPWMCYMGRYGVAYLESLGFDCLHDVIDHNHYDRLKENENKVGIFIWQALKTARELRDQAPAGLQARLLKAATWNRQLLGLYQTQWQSEWQQWQQIHWPHVL